MPEKMLLNFLVKGATINLSLEKKNSCKSRLKQFNLKRREFL